MATVVVLHTVDGNDLEFDIEMAKKSEVINGLLETVTAADQKIPVNVSYDVLDYIKKYLSETWKPTAETGFNVVMDIISAANYLNFAVMLDELCKFVADTYITGKSPQEIRTTFAIENDFIKK